MLYKKILVALDGSDGSWKALRKAIQLAKGCKSELTALSVDESTQYYPGKLGEVPEAANGYIVKIQAEAVAMAKGQGIALAVESSSGNAAHRIVFHAEAGRFDLIVIGQLGHSKLWGRLLGDTVSRVVDQAHCDVLVVR